MHWYRCVDHNFLCEEFGKGDYGRLKGSFPNRMIRDAKAGEWKSIREFIVCEVRLEASKKEVDEEAARDRAREQEIPEPEEDDPAF